jgi:hypothetical protein
MKIVALNGLLGYGYSQEALERVKKMKIDYFGVDAGSSDPGPFYLGNGTSFTNRSAVKRDLELVLPHTILNKIPFIIGTAGGSGANVHVNWLLGIIKEIMNEQKITCNIAIIQTEVTKNYVIEKIRENKVIDLSPNLQLSEEVVKNCNRIVSQIGIDPFLEALDSPKIDIILAGRACDTAIYAAPAIKAGYDPGLAFHMAKIMECGALCSVPMSASDIMIAEIEQDSFVLEPANMNRKCNVERVAAHTMYEQNNPYFIYEPDGVVDLRESYYEQITDRSVRVKNSKFQEAKDKTLKIEGTKLEGYRTITIAGINDPLTIKNIDMMFSEVKKFVVENMINRILPDEFNISLKKYGEVLPGNISSDIPQCSLGIIIDVVAKTQDLANTICALARARMLHQDFEGRKTTAGNLAFPYSPSDIICGPVYTFGIYHLVKAENLGETAKISYMKVGE